MTLSRFQAQYARARDGVASRYAFIPASQSQVTIHSGTIFGSQKAPRWGREGVEVITRPLRYRNKEITLPDGTVHTFLDGDEKGIDVRIALDVIAMAHRRYFDVAVLFCRDQDLAELADEVRLISKEQNRWIKMASAYPFSPAVKHYRGIDRTEWIRIERAMYDGCIDTRDYRPKPSSP